MSKVSIIIINYNTFTLTCDCIRSVIAHTTGQDYEIILVDNASTECNPDLFLEEFPRIKLIKSLSNDGFAGGNNKGIEQASGSAILLLNSDTILKENTIGQSVGYLESNNAGVVGCRMTYRDGGVQYSARRFRSITWELLDLFRFIPLLMSYPKRSHRMLGKYFRHDANYTVDWVNGAFFLFPRKVLEALPGGKLDGRFFMYGEDQLWCEQISQLGFPVLFFAGSSIIHLHSGSSSFSRQLQLRNTMMKHELEIMKLRKGNGIYYFLFKLIYVTKEKTRNGIKSIVYGLTGRFIR